jgi:hypothetical protein
MIDPTLVPNAALAGVDVGISVSDSADLSRLGLEPRHAELAIGEIARAVLIAGGRLTYGGRIRPSGFTQQLMHEVRRFGESRRSLTICLALPEHRKLSLTELGDIDRQLGTWGRLVFLDEAGQPIDPRAGRDDPGDDELQNVIRTNSYTGLRRYIARQTRAQVVVGGQLSNFRGTMPGVIEETIESIQAGNPVYFAGGFGGAAAAAAKTLAVDSFEWMPTDLPATDEVDQVEASLRRLKDVAEARDWSAADSGLDEAQRRQLAASHRPGEIASLVVLGLARNFGGLRASDGNGAVATLDDNDT